jgi:hypothetical protein
MVAAEIGRRESLDAPPGCGGFAGFGEARQASAGPFTGAGEATPAAQAA